LRESLRVQQPLARAANSFVFFPLDETINRLAALGNVGVVHVAPFSNRSGSFHS
jgi:hypothetical protein